MEMGVKEIVLLLQIRHGHIILQEKMMEYVCQMLTMLHSLQTIHRTRLVEMD